MGARVEGGFKSIAAQFERMDADFAMVRDEMRAGDEETRRLGLVFDDLMALIRIMGEGIDELRQRP